MPSFTVLEWIAVVVLGLVAIKLVYNLVQFLFTTFFGSILGLSIDLRKYGPWAVVTGATDGIGKAYAEQLASMGLNVVLISRSPSKLQATAQDLRSINPFVQVRTVAVDFTGDHSIYKGILAELADLDIGILINNVGMNVGFCQPFYDIKDGKQLDDIVSCNVLSMARMTHLILPHMVQRKRGVIINIGSISGAFSTPLATIYGATKAFVDKFSRDLSTELRSTGIVVQTVLPGFVLTNMSKSTTSIQKSSWMVPNPSDYVKANLRTLGLESRTASFWYHKIQLNFCETVCFWIPGVFNFFAAKYLDAVKPENENMRL